MVLPADARRRDQRERADVVGPADRIVDGKPPAERDADDARARDAKRAPDIVEPRRVRIGGEQRPRLGAEARFANHVHRVNAIVTAERRDIAEPDARVRAGSVEEHERRRISVAGRDDERLALARRDEHVGRAGRATGRARGDTAHERLAAQLRICRCSDGLSRT